MHVRRFKMSLARRKLPDTAQAKEGNARSRLRTPLLELLQDIAVHKV
jgi:hypothetical protein